MLATDKNFGLYSKVTNKKYTNARDYLVNTYARENIQYYNADTKKQSETKKNSNIRYFALITAFIGATVGITTALLRKKTDLSHLIKNGKNAFNTVKKSEFLEKTSNALSNLNNIKDEYWKMFTSKLAQFEVLGCHPLSLLDKIGTKSTDLYNKIACNSEAKIWNNKRQNLVEMAQKEGVELSIEEFKPWFDTLKNSIDDMLHGNGNAVIETIKGKKPKEIFKIITEDNIADKNIQKSAQYAISEVKVPEGASEKLKQEIANFNEYKYKIGCEFTSKLRDLCCGSATTDLLTQGATVASLATAIAVTDDKQEKKSIGINIGIPLITTMMSTTIALIKRISGAPALVFGLITGKCASFVANKIDEFNKKQAEKNN